MYDSRFCVYLVSAVDAWIKQRAYCGGYGAAVHVDTVKVTVDMAVIRCTEKLY